MSSFWGAIITIGLLVLGGSAFAQSLTLEGTWGNEAGCKFVKEGQSEDDSYLALKSDGVESYGTGCEWVQVLPGKSGAQVAIGLCGYEGEGGLGSETFVIARDMADPTLIKIYTNHGEVWGEVRKCP